MPDKFRIKILPDDPSRPAQMFMREGHRKEVHTAAVRQARHVFGEYDSGMPRATIVTERILKRKHNPPPAEGVLVRGERFQDAFKKGVKLPDGRVLN